MRLRRILFLGSVRSIHHCDQKPDERWIRCGTDEECSLSHPLSTSLTHKLVLDVAGMSIARGRSDRNKQPFLPPKHKSGNQGTFVVRALHYQTPSHYIMQQEWHLGRN